MFLPMLPARLSVSRVTLLIVALTSACRGSTHRSTRNPEGPSSSQALTGPKAPALKRCNAARENARAALDAGVAPGQVFASMTTACADLYSEPGCSNALRKAATLPIEARAASIARGCRDAYCPKFAPPKPALCAPEASQSPSQMLATWPELGMRILALELNVPVEEAARLVPRPSSPAVDVKPSNTVIPVQRTSADAGNAAIVVTVSLRVDANGRARTWVDQDPPELLPAEVDASNFAAVATNAKKRAATQVVIDVDERTTYSYVVGLVDALQSVGITNFGIQLAPSGEAASATARASGNAAPKAVAPNTKSPETEIPSGTLVATLIEAGAAKYSLVDIGADGSLRGKPFGPWDSMQADDVLPTPLGSIVVDRNCSEVQPPPISSANFENHVHVLSRPRSCAKLQLAPHGITQVSLQWYGLETNDRQIAVLRPTAVIQNSWMLVLSEVQLSPAGPWLALQTKDLDGDGMQDIAFVSQGVDGCDRGPCPLFWIELLLSRTHFLARNGAGAHKQGQDAPVLLDTLEFERRTGLTYMTISPSSLRWQSRAETGRYGVSLHAGKRTLTWTALIGANEVTLKAGEARK